jgi:hypothetical protein
VLVSHDIVGDPVATRAREQPPHALLGLRT